MDDVRRLIHLPEELLLIIAGYLSFQDCILLHEVNKLLNSIFHQFMIMKYKGIKKDFRNKDRLPMVQFYHLVKVYISNLSQLDIVFSSTDTYKSKVIFKALEQNTSLKFLNFAGLNTKKYKGEYQYCNLGKLLSNVILLSKALEINKSVVILDLYGNSIGNEGAIAIASALKINKTLTKLSLYDNRIYNEGAIAIAKALETNITLTNLSLAFNRIETEGIYTLATALKINTTLTRLDFSGNKGIGAVYFEVKEILKTGRKIKIPGSKWQ
jgi:hypothetical protein